MIVNANIQLDGVPRIFLFYKGKYHLYNEGDHLNLFLLFLNRVLNPVVKLKTEELTEMFFNTKVEWVESTPFYKVKYRSVYDIFPKMKRVTRVIAFISDEDKFSSQIKELYTAARELALRTDLRVGIVTNATIVKKYKDLMGTKWFNSTSSNSIVLFDNIKSPVDKKYYYDLESFNLSIKNWINFASLTEVNEFNPLNYQIMNMLQMPIFVAFCHKNYTQSESSKQLVDRLAVMAHEFPRILFSYIDDPDLYFVQNIVEIGWDDLPSLGLFNKEGMMPMVFPRNQRFTLPNLRAFLNAFMNGTIYSTNFTLPEANTNFGLNMKHAFEILLNNSTDESSKGSGVQRLQNNTVDTLLLVYNSSSFFTSYQASVTYEAVANVFARIGAKSVDFAYLDVAKSALPKYLQKDEALPHIQFLPAFSKGEVAFDTIQRLDPNEIIEYIRSHAKSDLADAFKTFDITYRGKDPVPQEARSANDVEIHEDL